MSETNAAHAKAVELGKHVLRMTTASASGHPSTALALSHIIVELMYKRMRYDLANPWNRAADRLVLSIGHAVPIVYAAYADLQGAVGNSPQEAKRLSVDDLSSLRELSSVLDGHPNPAEGFPFFDAATGSLGQGLSVGAGLALSAKLDGIDRNVYVIVGDGESREGQVWEAADFIVDNKLTNLCTVVSCNGHGQAGAVSPQQSLEAIGAKLAAFGFHVIEVDGHDPAQLSAAFEGFREREKPTAIVARTVKGWGVEMMLGKNFHGKPIPESELEKAISQLDDTASKLGAAAGDKMEPAKVTAVVEIPAAKPIKIPAFDVAMKRVGMDDALDKKKLSTRVAYGVAMVALGDADSRIIALDGDVSNSTFANMFAKEHPERFVECKIAEQNMVSVGAGFAASGKIPFASTFAKFVARANDQIDMAAITRANLKIVGSHSGASLGADGPSQMSLSDIAYFRSMAKADNGFGSPVCRVFHASDPVSAYRCTELAANTDGLCYIRTHRQTAPFLYSFNESFELDGCKRLRSGSNLTIASCGYILHTALAAAEKLAASGIECDVFDAYTFPMDAAPILDAARRGGGIVLTVEDNFAGGLHAELAEAAALAGDVRVCGMTVEKLPKSARSAEAVFSHVGVGIEQIVERAKSISHR